jgi:serine acetyltransferase
MLLFRLAQSARDVPLIGKGLSALPTVLYRGAALFVLSIDIPVSTQIGPGFRIHHGIGIVVHNRTSIGSNVSIRQNVTIGAAKSGGNPPQIGDDVDFGANCVVIGDILVGSGASIGAGAVATKSIPAGGVVVGNPARLLRINPPTETSD